MQQSRVKNSINAHEYTVDVERNGMPSMTVPDQTMSVREIMDRYARGLPIGGSRMPLFDEADELPDIKTLDLTEREDYREIFESELVNLKTKSKKTNVTDKVEQNVQAKSDESSSNAGGSEG